MQQRQQQQQMFPQFTVSYENNSAEKPCLVHCSYNTKRDDIKTLSKNLIAEGNRSTKYWLSSKEEDEPELWTTNVLGYEVLIYPKGKPCIIRLLPQNAPQHQPTDIGYVLSAREEGNTIRDDTRTKQFHVYKEQEGGDEEKILKITFCAREPHYMYTASTLRVCKWNILDHRKPLFEISIDKFFSSPQQVSEIYDMEAFAGGKYILLKLKYQEHLVDVKLYDMVHGKVVSLVKDTDDEDNGGIINAHVVPWHCVVAKTKLAVLVMIKDVNNITFKVYEYNIITGVKEKPFEIEPYAINIPSDYIFLKMSRISSFYYNTLRSEYNLVFIENVDSSMNQLTMKTVAISASKSAENVLTTSVITYPDTTIGGDVFNKNNDLYDPDVFVKLDETKRYMMFGKKQTTAADAVVVLVDITSGTNQTALVVDAGAAWKDSGLASDKGAGDAAAAAAASTLRHAAFVPARFQDTTVVKSVRMRSYVSINEVKWSQSRFSLRSYYREKLIPKTAAAGTITTADAAIKKQNEREKHFQVFKIDHENKTIETVPSVENARRELIGQQTTRGKPGFGLYFGLDLHYDFAVRKKRVVPFVYVFDEEKTVDAPPRSQAFLARVWMYTIANYAFMSKHATKSMQGQGRGRGRQQQQQQQQQQQEQYGDFAEIVRIFKAFAGDGKNDVMISLLGQFVLANPAAEKVGRGSNEGDASMLPTNAPSYTVMRVINALYAKMQLDGGGSAFPQLFDFSPGQQHLLDRERMIKDMRERYGYTLDDEYGVVTSLLDRFSRTQPQQQQQRLARFASTTTNAPAPAPAPATATAPAAATAAADAPAAAPAEHTP